jgi:hypothetical protein
MNEARGIWQAYQHGQLGVQNRFAKKPSRMMVSRQHHHHEEQLQRFIDDFQQIDYDYPCKLGGNRDYPQR